MMESSGSCGNSRASNDVLNNNIINPAVSSRAPRPDTLVITDVNDRLPVNSETVINSCLVFITFALSVFLQLIR